ncbi:MAG TPA: NAD(P)/FAD-dependent oxidoreductase [Gemmatimonadales bacterium]|nr:NAD(P)/FAD-dependent oxidoreductase [Gemmatimonadales bacterium]
MSSAVHTPAPDPVVIVGAGLAGLACADVLVRAGRRVRVLERERVHGGRVRTERTEGFLLDRGFQVLLTAYPEARRQLDYEALRLRSFYHGALVWTGRGLHRVADPRHHPKDAAASLAGPVGTTLDKLRMLVLRRRAGAGSLEELFRKPETTTITALRNLGFSNSLIDLFLRPFLAGIFLERELATSSRMLDFVVRMMAKGDVALPSAGMGAISDQLAARLPAGTIRTDAPVARIDAGGVLLESGESIAARAVVVATEGDVAARLTGRLAAPPVRGSTTVYYAADRSPVGGPYLILNGVGIGPVNSLCVPSDVAPTYAPFGQALVAASLLGVPAADDAALDADIRAQLRRWFGAQVDGWRRLRTYRIPWALPDQSPPGLEPAERRVQLDSWLFVAGDHRDNGSIHGALVSGRRTGEAVVASGL